MPLLDQYGKPFKAAPAAKARDLRARYDAAQTHDGNDRHWANADTLAPNAAASADVRATLRARARYEANENNSYAKGIVQTLAKDAIGRGPRLQITIPDRPEAAQKIEAAFARWAKAVKLAAKLRTMRIARTVDGEAFCHFFTNPELDNPVQLDLELIEADQITTPDAFTFGPYAVDGIQYDRYGNPKTYHKLKQHPGSDSIDIEAGMLKYDRIPAAEMIHLFRADRAGQRRGIPELTPALPLFAQLRRFTLSVLDAAETAADFAAILYTDSPEIDPDEEVAPFTSLDIERRMMTSVPARWKIEQLRAEQPTTNYEMFKREVLAEIARCLEIPYNIAAGNSSKFNYASGRLDHQTYYKAVGVDQSTIESDACDPIFGAWLDEAALVKGPDVIPPALPPVSEWTLKWFWDGTEHVDPDKEAKAQEKRLKNRTTTLAAEYARQGKDWETEVRQLARERDLLAELGLTPAAAAPTPAKKDNQADAQESEENAAAA